MSVFYLDSSAWVKRYFVEPGSGWVMRLFKSEERLASSVLGYGGSLHFGTSADAPEAG